MIHSQSQQGGDSSTNIQARQVVLNVGIDERRAREIYQEMNLQVRRDYTQESLEIANARVAEFENRLMPKMAQVEGALQAFTEPSFQFLLLEAQKTAASTERIADYDLLSELLIHRFRNGENRISIAVDIVDLVSDEALLGLTAAHAMTSFFPRSGDINHGLEVLDSLFGKIFYGKLPVGHDWLDHLDVLGAVRINPFGKLKKIQECYTEKLSGYIDVGIKKDSEDHNRAMEILKSHNLPADVLTEHSLNSDFLRVIVSSLSNANAIPLFRNVIHEGVSVQIPVALTEDQVKAVNSIYDIYLKDDAIKQSNINLLMEKWNKRKNLKALREWWDDIPTGFSLTSVGKVLAHSNAQRCDKDLPPLD
jgi:hypothetical protein